MNIHQWCIKFKPEQPTLIFILSHLNIFGNNNYDFRAACGATCLKSSKMSKNVYECLKYSLKMSKIFYLCYFCAVENILNGYHQTFIRSEIVYFILSFASAQQSLKRQIVNSTYKGCLFHGELITMENIFWRQYLFQIPMQPNPSAKR